MLKQPSIREPVSRLFDNFTACGPANLFDGLSLRSLVVVTLT